MENLPIFGRSLCSTLKLKVRYEEILVSPLIEKIGTATLIDLSENLDDKLFVDTQIMTFILLPIVFLPSTE